MTSPLKLAVIVATKNRSRLLAERSIPSIKYQIQKPEFLIVCDDSDTEVREVNRGIIRDVEIPGCKVSYLQNSRTSGASGCWNSALDFLLTCVDSPEDVVVAFLDDDDVWFPNYLEQCLNTMQAHDLDMVACGINRIESEAITPFQYPAPKTLNASLILVGNPGIQGSNLFLRLSTLLQAGGFDESLSSSTDRDLCIRLAELGSVSYQALPQILVNHYAESSRTRLSSHGSVAKLSGLTAFWQKYHVRMSGEQKGAFSQRAHNLFGWETSTITSHNPQNTQVNKALILAISSDISMELLQRLVEMFKYFRSHDLVGLDIVFHGGNDSSTQYRFIETLRNLGVGCFPIYSKKHLRVYSDHVAKLRPGSRIWVAEDLEKKALENFEDTEVYLSSCGAMALTEQELLEEALLQTDTHYINEHIHQQRVVSAKHRIAHHFNTSCLRVLGSGSEAIVFTDGNTVFKCIDYWKTRTPKAQFDFLRENAGTWKGISGIYPLQSVIRDGAWVLITYPYEASEPYEGGYEDRLIELVNGCTSAGIVCNNIHPKNLIDTGTEVKLIDYGSDIRPWNELGFEHMARRAFLSCWYADRPDLKDLMRQSLTDTYMPELSGFEKFRIKLDYPVSNPSFSDTKIQTAPKHDPFALVVGVISAAPIMLMPLLNSLRVLLDHPSVSTLSVIVLSNGCDSAELTQLLEATVGLRLKTTVITEEQQLSHARSGYFGTEIQHRPEGQVGIAFARTMLQRYLGNELAKTPGSIGWVLDDDMRVDERASDYIAWLPAFREQGVDVLFGAYEGSSPNPPLNGLRVQLMDLVHNLAWLSELPVDSILPDRTEENVALRERLSDYYYDLSRKHTAHLESPLWLEPIYPFETVKEARARLVSGALGILNGTPLTRSIVAPKCLDPLNEAKDSVNRGGCTFILNHDAVLRTPNLIPTLNGKEARRSDMIWAIINRHYRDMTLKAVAFPIYHVGRTSDKPTVNVEKVQGEIVGSALYAGLTDFLSNNLGHRLNFSSVEIDLIYQKTMGQMENRMRQLKQSFYRISGLVKALTNSPFPDELNPLINCIEQEFSLTAFMEIKFAVKKISKYEVSRFLEQMTKSTEAYNGAFDDFQTQINEMSDDEVSGEILESMSESTN